MAQYLAQQGVPSTFFMTGKQMRLYKDDVVKILQLKLPNGEYAHNIGNHSEFHSFEIRTRIDDAKDIAVEIINTNDLIQQAVKDAGVTDTYRFHKFYRPPFGTYSGKDIAEYLNDYSRSGRKELAELVGPVFWHTGGIEWDESKKYAADWKCWSYNFDTKSAFASVDECKQRYLNEIEDRRGRGQVILVHDVNPKIFDMLKGWKDLSKQLKSSDING